MRRRRISGRPGDQWGLGSSASALGITASQDWKTRRAHLEPHHGNLPRLLPSPYFLLRQMPTPPIVRRRRLFRHLLGPYDDQLILRTEAMVCLVCLMMALGVGRDE